MDRSTYGQMREVEDRHWWFSARREIVREVLKSLPLPAEPRILEAGCGTGGNLALLAQHGRITAFEPDSIAAAMARDRAIGPVLDGSLPDRVPSFENPFDLIVLLDVLEHIGDDVSTLRALRKNLAKGGYLVLTVPANQFLWSEHDVTHQHKRRYAAKSLADVMTRSGFVVRQLTYYNTLLFPVIAAVRLVERLLKLRQSIEPLRVPAAFINAALRTLFSSERHLVTRGRLPFGVSLLAFAQAAEPPTTCSS